MNTIQIRGAKSTELGGVHSMLERAFVNVPASFFDRRIQTSIGFKADHTRILLCDGRIVSCARIYFRKIRVGRETVLCGGLGDVGTDPEFRGRGFSSLCIDDAIRHMRVKGTLFSMLFTHIQPYYSRMGYFPIRTSDIILSPPEDHSEVRCRTTDLNRDLNRLKNIHDGYVKNRTGPVFRTDAYWKKQAFFPNLDQDLFWTGIRDNRIVSYARGLSAPDHLRIMEFGFEPGGEQALFSLLSRMARKTKREEIRISFVSGGENKLFRSWIRAEEENTRWMVRLIDLSRKDLLKELIKPGQSLFWDSDRF